MMFSETPEEIRSGRLEYIDQRWRQLHQLEKEQVEVILKYLLLINSGGAVAMLSFMGTATSIRESVWAKVVLGAFVLGMVLVGVLKVYLLHRVEGIFKKWKAGVHEYYRDRVTWEHLTDKDNETSAPSFWPYLIGYCAFGCFIAGAGFGIWSFIGMK